MRSIGPQLPPAAIKRKRGPDRGDDEGDDRAPPSTKHPRSRHHNPSEISLDDDNGGGADSDNHNEFGPRSPPARSSRDEATFPDPAAAAPRRMIGPSPPPTSTSASADEVSSPDRAPAAPRRMIGPSLPPTSTSAAEVSAPGPVPAAPRRMIGPSLPPPTYVSTTSPVAATDSDPAESDAVVDDDDDDDDYGPAPPSAPDGASLLPSEMASHLDIGPAAPQRDAWMLAPPGASSSRHAPDPSKLRARKFASGPRAAANSASAAASATGEIGSIWTETGDERRRRLENAVLGRGEGTASAGGERGPADHLERLREREARENKLQVEAYNAQMNRGRSLYSEHQARKRAGVVRPGEEEEDDPSKRAFDKDKDMGLSLKVGTAQRRELLTRSADFGGRFSGGSYL